MSRKRSEPERREPEAYLPARESIPGIKPDLVGWGRYRDPEKHDTVLQGHPEAAGIYCQGYDNNSRSLESEPYRMDRNYVSPETIRRGSKSPFGG